MLITRFSIHNISERSEEFGRGILPHNNPNKYPITDEDSCS